MTDSNYSNGLYFKTYATENEHFFIEEEIRSSFEHSVQFYRKMTPHEPCFRECFIRGDVANIKSVLKKIVKIVV